MVLFGKKDNEVLEALKKGEVICRFEWGDSMHPILKNGEYAKLIPIDDLSKIKIVNYDRQRHTDNERQV